MAMMQWEQRIRAGADSPKLSDLVRADFRACIFEMDALRKDAARYRWVRNNPQWLGWDTDFLPHEVERELDAAMVASGAVVLPNVTLTWPQKATEKP